MNLRTKSVLEAAVKEYIQRGVPVSSKELAAHYDFGVKDASVRSELSKLTQEGFLAHPHTSGGRVPTDKGYQFFVAQTLSDVADTKRIMNERYGALAGNLLDGNVKDFINALSDETKLLGVGKRDKDKEVYKSGLDELVGHLDIQTKNEFQEVVHDFEMLDKRMAEFRKKLHRQPSTPQVFIGKESPITASENLSVIVDNYEIKDQQVFIGIIGPKRMDYGKNLKLMKLFRNYLSDHHHE